MAVANCRSCEKCGREFTSSQPRAKYCSRECNLAAWDAKRKVGLPHLRFTCQQCGKEYEAKAADRDKFCSRECNFKYKAEHRQEHVVHWWFGNCQACGERFIAGNKTQRLCGSADCRREYHRRKAAAAYVPVLTARPCPGCHNVTIQGRAKLCLACSSQRKRRFKRDRSNPRRRARRAGVPYAVVPRSVIVQAYGTKCWICEKRIDMKAKATEPESFSVDHVVPLALGGWHDLTNVRPAHFACNSKKGAAYRGQLMLTAEKE